MKKFHIIYSISLTIFLISFFVSSLQAKGGGNRKLVRAFSPMKASLDQMEERGFKKTGLQPDYPKNVDCPKITSPFGSDTRSDGSFRSDRFYNGYHGGADFPTAEGTPILAMSDGTVIQKKEGKGIGGIKVILQHSPEDTGLNVWTYSEYKHLKELPEIEVGDAVKMGDNIGLTGNTGTTGGHYGPFGFVHLHLSTYMSPDDEYVARRLFAPIHGQWIDPVAFLKGNPIDTNSVLELLEQDKKVKFAYKTTDGKTVPETAKIIWPYACKPKLLKQ